MAGACKQKLPPAPQFGTVGMTVLDNQVIAQYECDKGYRLAGPSNLTCTTSLGARWLGRMPQCKIDIGKVYTQCWLCIIN